jgi:hypothetical protein
MSATTRTDAYLNSSNRVQEIDCYPSYECGSRRRAIECIGLCVALRPIHIEVGELRPRVYLIARGRCVHSVCDLFCRRRSTNVVELHSRRCGSNDGVSGFRRDRFTVSHFRYIGPQWRRCARFAAPWVTATCFWCRFCCEASPPESECTHAGLPVVRSSARQRSACPWA